MLQISQVISKAENMFHAFNEHFYNGELITPAITVTPDGGRGAYGWITTAQVWRNGEDTYYELNICAEYLDRPLSEIARTVTADPERAATAGPSCAQIAEHNAH